VPQTLRGFDFFITVGVLVLLSSIAQPSVNGTLVQPAIVGVVCVDANVGKDAWIVAPGGNLTMRIIFQPKKGLAKGVSILLRTYGLELAGSNPFYHGIFDETYRWRYTTVKKGAPETINLALRIPNVEESRYVVRFWYEYTNMNPASLANVSLLASYNASEYDVGVYGEMAFVDYESLAGIEPHLRCPT